ncbi:MAG: helix-turn-helix domain-containing protein [Gammaproteobacteria bacterium]
MQPIIPPPIRRFILTSIASVPHLEALLLLRASAPQGWPAAQVAERLYIGAAAATRLLGDLVQRGMLREDGGQYLYAPSGEHLRTVIDELAALYARHLVEVTHLIHSRLDRQAQHFADSFRWRKDS